MIVLLLFSFNIKILNVALKVWSYRIFMYFIKQCFDVRLSEFLGS